MSSGAIAGSIAGSIAAVQAAEKRKREQEEERMVQYSNNDLDGWEFKIVRSSRARFKNTEVIERVRNEEAATGWEMVEKFDDYRLRFKRRIERRSMDAHIAGDPYRTQIDSSSAKVSVIIGVLLLIVGIGLLVAMLAAR